MTLAFAAVAGVPTQSSDRTLPMLRLVRAKNPEESAGNVRYPPHFAASVTDFIEVLAIRSQESGHLLVQGLETSQIALGRSLWRLEHD
jgi:hypothetical protein